jgi:hypothetical protein
VPPTLLTQWIGEIEAFSERFRVILYHGDTRQGLEERGHDNVKMVMSRDHRKLRFGQNDETGALPKIRLVLSGHETWRGRHGPASLKKVRPDDRTQSGVSRMKPPVKADKWGADMADVYRMVVVDEAHVLRNPRSFMHQSVEWARTDFRLLMTATAVWAHPRDFSGLLSLCEPPGLSEAAEEAIGPLGRNGDPWLAPKGHAHYRFRFTRWAFEAFAVEDGVVAQNMAELGLNDAGEPDDGADELHAAAYIGAETFASFDVSRQRADRLRELFQRYVSRHDYETQLEGHGRIGAQVPPRLAYHLQCPFDVQAQDLYEAAAGPHMDHLFVPDPKTKRLVINGEKLRKLNLASISPGMLYSELLADAHNKKTMASAAAAKLCADGLTGNRPSARRETTSRWRLCAKSPKNCSRAAT